MPLVLRKRIPLWRSRTRQPAAGGRTEPRTEVWLNLKLPTRRQPSPINIGVRHIGVTWNTERGLASIRSRRAPGLSWQDRD